MVQTAPTTPASPARSGKNYEVGADGQWRTLAAPASSLLRRFPQRRSYRLYRFLSDLEDLVDNISHDRDRLRIGAVLLRRLVEACDWLTDACPTPDPSLGWAVHFLYDEPGYPFTVQLVSWLPQQRSPIHNHAAWGLVMLLGDPATAGREENHFWQRTDDDTMDGKATLQEVSQVTLHPGDLIGFTPTAIHQVRAIEANRLDPQPTFTVNVYGKTDFNQRFTFDPLQQSCQLF
ncbi:MAG: cupin [Cyanobacteriota bacterium]|nr:cupin [Cyanobacteriota bacterium]